MVEVFIASSSYPQEQIGAYGFHTRIDHRPYFHGECFSETTGPRMLLRGIIDALKVIRDSYGKGTVVSINSDQQHLVNVFVSKHSNKHQDDHHHLYEEVFQYLLDLKIIVPPQNEVNEIRLTLAKDKCAAKLHKGPNRVEFPDKRRPTPLF